MEVDERTRKREHLKVGRLKILLDKSVTLPLQVPVWVEDLRFMVLVEEEKRQQESREGRGEGLGEKTVVRGCCCRSLMGRKEEDDDIINLGLNFKQPACIQPAQFKGKGSVELLGWDPTFKDRLGRGGPGGPKRRRLLILS